MKQGCRGTCLTRDNMLEKVAGVLMALAYQSTYTHVLLVASSHCVEHSRVTWKMELKMRATDRSASRGPGPARWTETTPVAAVMAWDCAGGLLPQNFLGARCLVVVAMCGNSAVPKVPWD